jgi:K+-sensing histidine kinase KdpD
LAGVHPLGADLTWLGAVQSSVLCCAADMGNGIPPNQMENMFSYFYTSNKPASTL